VVRPFRHWQWPYPQSWGDSKWLAVAVRRTVWRLRAWGQVHETRGLAGDWLIRRTAQHLGTREA